MGKKSIKKDKSIYQIYREEAERSREKAADLMVGVSDSRIEKIEYGTQAPTPYDVIQMSKCYKHPDLCNYFCTHECEIGAKYVPELETEELPAIILKMISSLNEVNKLAPLLVQIGSDGVINDNEIKDFAKVSKTFNSISAQVQSLNLWIEKTAIENNINMELLTEEKNKLNPQG